MPDVVIRTLQHDGCAVRIAYGALEKATVVEGIGRLVTGLRAMVGGP